MVARASSEYIILINEFSGGEDRMECASEGNREISLAIQFGMICSFETHPVQARATHPFPLHTSQFVGLAIQPVTSLIAQSDLTFCRGDAQFNLDRRAPS